MQITLICIYLHILYELIKNNLINYLDILLVDDYTVHIKLENMFRKKVFE